MLFKTSSKKVLHAATLLQPAAKEGNQDIENMCIMFLFTNLFSIFVFLFIRFCSDIEMCRTFKNASILPGWRCFLILNILLFWVLWWNKLLITFGMKSLILRHKILFLKKYSAQHWQYSAIAISVGVVDKHEREQHVSIFQRKLNSCPAVIQMRRASKHVWYAKWLPILYFT